VHRRSYKHKLLVKAKGKSHYQYKKQNQHHLLQIRKNVVTVSKEEKNKGRMDTRCDR